MATYDILYLILLFAEKNYFKNVRFVSTRITRV